MKALISAVIVTFNEETSIQKCLHSVSWADEIVVVDNFSTDRTVDICREFGAKVVQNDHKGQINFNRNLGFQIASGDWIFNIDADERATDELAHELRSVITSETPHNGFYVARRNYFLGKWIRGCGWYPDYLVKSFRKGTAHYRCAHLHERIDLVGTAGYLSGYLLHFNYPTLSQYLAKLDFYTTFEAKYISQIVRGAPEYNLRDFLANPAERKPYMRYLWWRYVPLKPLVRFVYMFFWLRGFVDGYYGLLLSTLSAFSDIISQAKARELLNRKSAESELPLD